MTMPVKTRKRVTYVLPLPAASERAQLLALPPANVPRQFDPRPLLYSAVTGSRIDLSQAPPTNDNASTSKHSDTPQHCLGVSKLAIDLSTVVLPSKESPNSSKQPNPKGLLYSAGRDGLVISHELNLPTVRRKRRAGVGQALKRARLNRWQELGAFYSPDESDNEEEEEEDLDERDEASSDEEMLQSSSARQHRDPHHHSIPFEEKWELDHDAFSSTPTLRTQFRQSVQPHTDWINDLILCNLNRTVITASSDQTIRAWNPHDPEQSLSPSLLGTHEDYVRSLAYCREGQWVASGGFDRKIKIWDIKESRTTPLVELTDQSPSSASIYSLATHAIGSLIASGSPERIVRLWDPRSVQQRAGQLVGHQDNVRAILMSDDGRHILTASADSTIKLWPVSMQRCLHTFTYHNDSVWSLFSSHPNLDVFYSGDRTGLVCKVDMETCGDVAEAECVVLLKDDDASSSSSAQSSSSVGINSIVALDNELVWTASASSSIQCWKDIPPRVIRNKATRPSNKRSESLKFANVESMPLLSRTSTGASDRLASSPGDGHEIHDRRAVSFAPDLSLEEEMEDRRETSTSFALPTQSSVKPSSLSRFTPSRLSEPRSPISYESSTLPELHNIPLESQVCLDPDAGYTRRSFGTGSVLSFPSAYRVSSIPQSLGNSLRHQVGRQQITHSTSFGADSPLSEHVQPVSASALIEFEDREMACDAVPLRLSPAETIPGRTGLIRCEMLNDRRTVLTLDTAGEIAVWDIVLGRCIGVIDKTELVTSARKRRESQTSQISSSVDDFLVSEQRSSVGGAVMKELLSLVKNRIQGEGITTSWSTVDVRVGTLSVHLDEAHCFSGEAYLDESCFEGIQADEYQRINLGKIVLRNLFDSFVQAEMLRTQHETTRSISPPTRMHRSFAPSHINFTNNALASIDQATPRFTGPLTIATALATPAPSLVLPPSAADVPLLTKELAAIPQSPSVASSAAVAAESDYFSLPNSSSKASPITPGANSNGFVGKLKSFGRMPKRTPGAILDDTNALASEPQQHPPPSAETVPVALHGPFAPPTWQEVPRISYGNNLVFYVAEESQGSAAWPVLYRSMIATAADQVPILEEAFPTWLLDMLLYNRVPVAQPPKITFVLEPWNGPSRAGLPEMPTGHARLTANRLLRMHKAAAFVADKIDIDSHSTSALGKTTSHTSLSSHFSMSSSLGSPNMPSPRHSRSNIELLCNNVVLPSTATLAAVRQYCYKKGGDLLLHYRLVYH